MKMKLFTLALTTGIRLCATAQQPAINSPKPALLTTIQQLQQTVAADSNKAFVHIADYVPGVVLDIKYATTANVFYEHLYDQPYAITRLSVAKALCAVQADLKQHGAGLKIYDAYRPYSVTCRMFEILPDTIYMGLPATGSKHNRGIALDLTLVNLQTGKELDMPTPFDALVYASHPDYMGLPIAVLENRKLLRTVMEKHGFTVDPVEWWHYNYAAAKAYELLDIPQKEILPLIRTSSAR